MNKQEKEKLRKTLVRKLLAREYQPQWHFKSKKSALKELVWQRGINPSTYQWLKRKSIKVGGRKIKVKSLLKR